MRFRLLIPLLFVSTLAFSQFTPGLNKTLGIEVFDGFILQHKPQISHLITKHPIGFRVTMDKKVYGSEPWQQRYNYPDMGMTFVYMDYRNPVLGKTLGLIPHINFYLRGNREAKGQLQFKMGFGMGYTTNKYNPETNNKNNVISTDLTGAVLFQFGYQYQLTDKLFFNSSASVTHFSNGAIKKPNSGINIIATNLGLSYMIRYEPKTFNFIEEKPLENKVIGASITLTGGAHESLKIGSGAKPFFVLSGLMDKQLNHKSRLGLGMEWFYSASLKDEIKYDDSVDKGTDSNRIGLYVSHELMINEFSIMGQVGYYIYDPYKPYQSVYLRLGLRRYFTKKLYSSIGVKSHSAKAEAMEFAIGYRLK
ncbi:MAG TPA: acyloxyacyl hydrolase [Fulvivirga sp.]|nr:acyloxyacyl hydrolase [Fulvivirga sp.]